MLLLYLLEEKFSTVSYFLIDNKILLEVRLMLESKRMGGYKRGLIVHLSFEEITRQEDEFR